jgi:stress-induced morphogen
MSQTTVQSWKSMRTKESRQLEKLLRTKFPHTDAYRYNSASIRVRVVDRRFKGKSVAKRDDMVEPLLAKLPAKIQGDIMNLLTLYPRETEDSLRARVANLEFEEPTPSLL